MQRIVLHDYFESLEGGGRLSTVLAHYLPADIGYGFARAGHAFLTPLPSSLRHHDLATHSRLPLWRQFKLSRAFAQQTGFLQNYETVVYSGFYTPLAILNHRFGRNLYYCHTPPRFIYDQRQFYLDQVLPVLRPLLKQFTAYLQPRYEEAIRHMDQVVTNSEQVRQRLQHFLGIPSIVVHPPCNTQQFMWRGQGNYYLSVARLDPLKRVDLIVQAFLKLPQYRLIVASGGSESHKLRKLAAHAPHIQFTGWVSESTLMDLVGNAIATLYLPHNEDFGMSPVESMAAGKPVIGVAEGGLLETIIPEVTGILLPPQLTVQSICEAVNYLTPQKSLELRQSCEKRARQFDQAVFLAKMRDLVVI